MRKTLLAIALTLAAGSVLAENRELTSEEAHQGLKDVLCSLEGVTAKLVMQSRQNGVGMGELMNRMMATAEPEDQPKMRRMVIGAYDTPRYTTPALRREVLQEYENEWALNCFLSQ